MCFCTPRKWCNMAAATLHSSACARQRTSSSHFHAFRIVFTVPSLAALIHILEQQRTCIHPLQLWLVSKFPAASARFREPSLSHHAYSIYSRHRFVVKRTAIIMAFCASRSRQSPPITFRHSNALAPHPPIHSNHFHCMLGRRDAVNLNLCTMLIHRLSLFFPGIVHGLRMLDSSGILEL